MSDARRRTPRPCNRLEGHTLRILAATVHQCIYCDCYEPHSAIAHLRSAS